MKLLLNKLVSVPIESQQSSISTQRQAPKQYAELTFNTQPQDEPLLNKKKREAREATPSIYEYEYV
jgi:hypothetical protein